LKHYFAEHGSLYIDFVNAPTIEGYTPLHLCGMWKAEKCFIVLNYYGGLALTSKDKFNKSPLEVASQYHCKKIVETLSSYRMLSISFTMLESERLISGAIIAEDQVA
jgi:hypothetical protein